jgi:hypothetical protein
VSGVPWECYLPRAEAISLSGEGGPLSNGLPGTIIWPGEGPVVLDDSAFDSLRHLGHISGTQDGRITFDGETPCITFGRDRWPVYRAAEGKPRNRLAFSA